MLNLGKLRGHFPRVLAAFTGAAIVASCTQIMESSLYEHGAGRGPEMPSNCHSALGAYYLPQTYVHVTVSQVSMDGKVVENRLDLVETITRANTNRMFCLDYLASAFADDQVVVQKTSSSAKAGSQLLSKVASNSVDQTSMIVRTLIKAAFVSISGFRKAVVRTDPPAEVKEPLADFEYDPFDQAQSTAINEQLRQYGFCLVLETYTFGQPSTMADKYCNSPARFLKAETAFGRSYTEFNTAYIAPTTPGILYRPRQSYQLNIYGKDDPKGNTPWVLRRTMSRQFENISPILSVKLDRAAFTLKQIALVFDNGALHSACISKKSEAVEVIKIPLEIVKGIAALPTSIFQVQYDNITKSTALAKAEYALINAQNQLIAIQKGTQENGSPSLPGASPITGPETFQIPTGPLENGAPPIPTNPLEFVTACNGDDAAAPARKQAKL